MNDYIRRGVELASTFSKTMQCNCDLDNWEPERSTGHSWVCRIHKATLDVIHNRRADPTIIDSKVLERED